MPARTWWWRWSKRALTAAFFVAVAALIVTRAREVDWLRVLASIHSYGAPTLIVATLLAVASQFLHSAFDLHGRAYSGHRLSFGRTMSIAFVSYAFNLNFGSLVGGFAFRYRLYSRYGLDARRVGEIIAAAVATNWLGYLLLGGLVFATGQLSLPDGWRIGNAGLRTLGTAMVAAALGYLAICRFAKRRVWRLRSLELRVPRARTALLQFAHSSLNWTIIAGIVFVLLGRELAFGQVLGVLLLSGVAGAASHVPAGLGVIEAVFLAVLGGRVPQDELLAALLTFRGLYYLAPLLIALALYAVLESRAEHGKARHRQPQEASSAGQS